MLQANPPPRQRKLGPPRRNTLLYGAEHETLLVLVVGVLGARLSREGRQPLLMESMQLNRSFKEDIEIYLERVLSEVSHDRVTSS